MVLKPFLAFSAFVDTAVGDQSNLFRTSSVASDVGNLVQSFDAWDNVTENPRELGVHVGQNNPKLWSHLKNNNQFYQKKSLNSQSKIHEIKSTYANIAKSKESARIVVSEKFTKIKEIVKLEKSQK